MAQKPTVFAILPFRDEFIHLYEELKKRFNEQYDFINAKDLDNQQSILKDIVVGISEASVVIADLTGLNPNVFYELGLAHAMGKKVIIITQDMDELPFDIRSYRIVGYSLLFYKIPELLEELEKLLAGALDGSVKYGNPVSDFLPDYFQSLSRNMNSSNPNLEGETANGNLTVAIEQQENAGAFDYIADIEENTVNMTKELGDMKAEIAEMKTSVVSASKEINRVKVSSGNVDASFVRNICRKLAAPMDDFSMKLGAHITQIDNYWSTVESSYLALLENPFVLRATKKETLRDNLKSINSLKEAMAVSDEQVKAFSDSLQGGLGIERRLNKAIGSLINELNAYLTMTSTMAASIDRIMSKGDIVLSLMDGN